MASYYVYSAAAGAGTGADWANAYTTLATAISGKAAGDVFYVADDHAESTAGAITYTFPGTAASPNRVLCALRSGGSVPPVPADLRTTGAITSTGTNTITFSGGVVYIYGIAFSGSSGSTSNNGWDIRLPYGYFKNCKLKVGNTNTASRPNVGATSSNCTIWWDNTTLEFSATGQSIRVGIAGSTAGRLNWINTANAIAGATLPTTLFTPLGGTTMRVFGVDLSALGSGATLVSPNGAVDIQFTDCKLGASVTKVGSYTSHGQEWVSFTNCDSGNTNYNNERYTPEGTETTETTVVRTGGASDGTTPVSRKMAAGTLASLVAPMRGMDMVLWNERTGSAITVALPVLTDNVTLTDAEAWIEVGYLSDTSFSLGSTSSDAVATVLTTPANQATDSVSSWVTTGIGTPVKQTLATSFTPQKAGYLYVRAVLAKASTTMYVDPLPQVT